MAPPLRPRVRLARGQCQRMLDSWRVTVKNQMEPTSPPRYQEIWIPHSNQLHEHWENRESYELPPDASLQVPHARSCWFACRREFSPTETETKQFS